MHKGLLITFEGIDGAGKTTQLLRLASWLEAQGLPVVVTREPGGTRIGDAVRAILLDPRHQEMEPRTEALLYAASRAQHVEELIRPALARGEIVLCDRFVDASIAYQGAGLGLGEAWVEALNEYALGGLRPDLTLWFDLDWSSARSRLRTRAEGGGLDRIERRGEAFFERVMDAFERLWRAAPEVRKRIDAARSPEDIEQEIRALVWNLIQQHL
ncbi:MAG: dTMP kinase [Alicyclobacillus mali]|uniref:dTMP kinase n=1 Tax=Alicyclobacillus mali (ex Roth et al. 2021) TaxID=1123961 RepID=UPI00082CF8CE|nr:dTMP kinase [Alicyclobacillus mali (ex Roth et al. 2021)]MCL6488942.1 dTMP kinase [Alicyclobacillus mali (ex Roth et al. 2021)]